MLLLLLCPAIRWHTPQASPRADEIGDGDDYKSLVTLVTVAIAVFAKHKRHTLLLLVFVEDEDRQPSSATCRSCTRSTGARGKTALLASSAHGVFFLAPPTKLRLRVR